MCGCGARPKTSSIQPKPLNTFTSNQNVSESQTAKVVGVFSGADLVWATQITYYFSFDYLQSQSHGIDTGPLCICLPALSPSPPATPPPLRLLSSALNTFGAGLPLWLKNTLVSMVPFFLCACPFGSALARGGFWPGETCAALMKICVSVSSKGQTLRKLHILTAHFVAQMASAKSPWHDRTPTRNLNIFRLILLKLKCDQPGSPAVDGWIVIKGQGCWCLCEVMIE